MPKYFKIYFSVIVIVILIATALILSGGYGEARLRHFVKPIPTLQNTGIAGFKDEIDILVRDNETPGALKTILQEAKIELNKPFKKPQMNPNIVIEHISGENTLRAIESLAYVKKILNLNKTLTKLEKQIVLAKNEAIKMGSTNVVKQLKALQLSTKSLSGLLAKQDFTSIDAKIQTIKKVYFAPLIKSTNVSYKSQNSDSTLTKNMMEIRETIQIDMPSKISFFNSDIKLGPVTDRYKKPKKPTGPRKIPSPIETFTDPDRIIKIGFCLSRWTTDEISPTEANLEELETYTRNFILENSYGIVDVSFVYGGRNVVFSPIYVSPDHQEDTSQAYYDYAELLMCNGLNFEDIDIFIHSVPGDVFSFMAGGALPLVLFSSEFPGEYSEIQRIMINNDFIGFKGKALSQLITHEMGHIFGAGHANGYECNESSYKLAGCEILEYGNMYDKMGILMGHFGAHFKQYFGWITTLTVTEDGNYDIGALSNPSRTPQQFLIPFRDHNVCVEYRKPLGEDDFLTRYAPLESSSPPNLSTVAAFPAEGELLIYLCEEDDWGRPVTYLIDTTPGSNPQLTDNFLYNTDFLDAALPIRTLWSNSDLGIEKIAFRNPGDSRHRVRVEIELDESKL